MEVPPLSANSPERDNKPTHYPVPPHTSPFAIDIAILTEAPYLVADSDSVPICQIRLEEALLMQALNARGVRVRRVAWDDPGQDWTLYRAAIIRSTWQYCGHFAQFSRWLDKVSLQTRLFNSLPLIRWNIDKHYLADLQQSGIATVPTYFVAAADRSADLVHIMAELGCTEIVFKPVISGSARMTFRASLNTIADAQQQIQRCLVDEAMMVQPFVPSILSVGELSLIVIGGLYTHAVRKVPKAGDFRVQDEHGGVVLAYEPDVQERQFAEAVVAACPEPPLYARVDVVRTQSGQLMVMELELIEPELFLRFYTPAAHRLADALLQSLG